jgi:integrase
MRPSEIVGLQVSDFHEGTIHVERKIYRGKVDVPKSRRSRLPRSPNRDYKSAGIAVAGATAGTHAGRLVIPIRDKQHAGRRYRPC